MSIYEIHRVMAEATKGISAEYLYDLHEKLMAEHCFHGDILDCGAGQGFLTQRLLHGNRFKSVSAADIMAKPQHIAVDVSWVPCDLDAELPFQNETFDSIVCCEVISCIENPRALAREWFRLLRPGGQVIFSTPNNVSLRSLLSMLLKGYGVVFGPKFPYQKTALVPWDLEQLMSEAGFNSLQLHFSNRGGIPKKPTFTWQSISLGVLKGRWFSDHVFMVGKKTGESS